VNEKKTSYIQGMHEILSMFIFVLYPYYFENKNKKNKKKLLEIYLFNYKKEYLKSLYLFFHDENNLECDLYYLFFHLWKNQFLMFLLMKNVLKDVI